MPAAVVTREPDTYASVLASLGLAVVAMPVTRTAPPADPDALKRALAQSWDIIFVASPRAAAALGTVDAELWAVGPATQRALGTANVAPSARDAVELAQHLIGRGVVGKRILVPRAEEGRVDAIDLLREAGAHVTDVIAYRTVPVTDDSVAPGREALAAGEAAVCCVFAPSQVTALAALVGPLSAIATRWCAIGETTAAALRSAGIAEVSVAPSPTPEGMAQAVRSVYPPRR